MDDDRRLPPQVTGREMCEYIADWLFGYYGIDRTWEDVWYQHPGGELWPVYALYWQAWAERQHLRIEIQQTFGPPGAIGDIRFVPMTG